MVRESGGQPERWTLYVADEPPTWIEPPDENGTDWMTDGCNAVVTGPLLLAEDGPVPVVDARLDDARIEKAARAICEVGPFLTWDRLRPRAREAFMSEARAALISAGFVPEGSPASVPEGER